MDRNKEMIPLAKELTLNIPQKIATISYTFIFRPIIYAKIVLLWPCSHLKRSGLN